VLSALFRTKGVDAASADAEASENKLKRSLGVIDLTALGIGAVIGAGIFSAPGSAAAGADGRLPAGPALIVSYILVAIACGFAALCYAELAAVVPVSGSAYTYTYVTLGEIVAWIIGWDLILEYAVGNVAVAVSWADYFKSLLAGSTWHPGCPPPSTMPGRLQASTRPRHTSSAFPSSSTFRRVPSSRSSPCCWSSVSRRARASTR